MDLLENRLGVRFSAVIFLDSRILGTAAIESGGELRAVEPDIFVWRRTILFKISKNQHKIVADISQSVAP
ncbi:MAG: hypothetical protein ACLFRG_09815 [Desulfococcaceae bacterium]